MKKPWLAATLNIISGTGYIYINPKRLFGWLILVSTLLAWATFFDNSPATQVYANSPATIWDTVSFLSGTILTVAFIVDGYHEAKRSNKKSPTKKRSK